MRFTPSIRVPFYASRVQPGPLLHKYIIISAVSSIDESCFSIFRVSDLLYLYVRAGIALAVA